MKYLTVFVLFVSIFCAKAEEDLLPDYITPCSLADKEFEKCVKEQIEASLPYFTKGIPALGVDSTDPVNIDDIILDGNGLTLKLTQAQMHGLSNSKLKTLKVEIGQNDEKFSLGILTDLSLTAKYTADGKILILPIKGAGDALIKCTGIKVEINSKLIHIKGDKGEYFKLVSPDYKYDIELTKFEFENLFSGNKQLADTTLQFINENWRQIMEDIAPPAIKQIVKTIVKTINKFFSKFPISRIVKGYKEKS